MCAADLATTNGSVGLLARQKFKRAILNCIAFGHLIGVFSGRRVGRSSSKFDRAGCFCFPLGYVNGQRIDVSSDYLFRAVVLDNRRRSTLHLKRILLRLAEASAMHAGEVFRSSIQTSIRVRELGRHVFNYLLFISC